MRGVESDALQQQADLMTPEYYYNRAAFPEAQEQERESRAAVMARLSSGGVLGPALAKGEYSIGR
jgi:hypothetical protein